MTKSIAYGRVGLLGNPSDMYGVGKCISFTIDRSAEVEIKDSLELRIESGGIVENNLNYNGRHNLVKAVLNKMRPNFSNGNVDIRYRSDIPVGAGLAGSSAIVIATLRALGQYFNHHFDNFQIAEFATRTEIDELKIPSGFQDRYVISFEGLCYMDFKGKESMQKEDSYGEYPEIKRLDISEIPCFLALSGVPKSSATIHNPLMDRYLKGSAEEKKCIKNKMDEIALLAKEGEWPLLQRNWEEVGKLMNRNHELRKEVGLSRKEDEEIVEQALKYGALGAKVAGSGGAVVILTDEEDRNRVCNRMKEIYKCFKPKIVAGGLHERYTYQY